MSLFNKEPQPRPYLVEMTAPGGDPVEVKVEAYDVMEAVFCAALRATTQHGEDLTRVVTGVRPDVDKLRFAAAEDSVVRRIVDAVGHPKLEINPKDEL